MPYFKNPKFCDDHNWVGSQTEECPECTRAWEGLCQPPTLASVSKHPSDKVDAPVTAYECRVHRWFGVGICPECRTMPSIQNSQLWTNTALSMAGCVSTQVFRDEQGDGCDISAGLYGPHLSAFISQIAFLLDEYCPPATLKNVLNQFKAE